MVGMRALRPWANPTIAMLGPARATGAITTVKDRLRIAGRAGAAPGRARRIAGRGIAEPRRGAAELLPNAKRPPTTPSGSRRKLGVAGTRGNPDPAPLDRCPSVTRRGTVDTRLRRERAGPNTAAVSSSPQLDRPPPNRANGPWWPIGVDGVRPLASGPGRKPNQRARGQRVLGRREPPDCRRARPGSGHRRGSR